MSKNQKTYWLSGPHSVEPALYNPRRVFRRLVRTKAFPLPERSQLEARRRATAVQWAMPWETVSRLPPPELVASMPSLGFEPASSRSFEGSPGGPRGPRGGQERRPARDVAGLVEPLPPVPLSSLLHHPFVLVLDQITDVGNLERFSARRGSEAWAASSRRARTALPRPRVWLEPPRGL